MILEFSQIKEIILDNPGKARVEKGRQYRDKLRRHLYGTNLDKYFEQIEGFERLSLKNLRNKYSKSNKDLFSRLGRPIDKVFTARGGSFYLNLPETQEKKARVLATDVRDGYSARKWTESFWKPHMADDPFGIIFLELPPKPEIVRLKNEGKSFVIPTYKSISEIFDYLPKGNRVEYVCFELGDTERKKVGLKDGEKLFRLVDDAKDYYVKLSGQDVSIIETETLVNYFGQVPAIVNSDIVDPEFENCFLSVYDEVIELAEDFLLDGSIRRVHKFMHGFPKYAEFADDCMECRGEGVHEGKKCEACGGTGKKAMLRVSDVKLMQWPTKEDAAIMPSNVAAYISPDKVFFDISTADLSDLENLMTMTLWGVQSKVRTQGMAQNTEGPVRTATEVMDEIRPQADRLTPISEMAEKREKFILDFVIRLNLSLPNYKGCSLSYGRRYMLESPDAIWLKYSDARTKGAPQSVLDAMLNEYYDTNYQSDPVGLAVAKKLMYVEPFVHFAPAVLKNLSPDPADYAAKLYFSEWLSTLEEGTLLSQNVDELKAQLYEYAKGKKIPEDKPQPVAA